jgi:phosphoglycolate phosphatase-like HAD superfamily hydrolase
VILLLFDIDGTLVSGATEAHSEALRRALLTVHGVHVETIRGPVSPAGRTDGEIARTILLEAGVSARRIDELADEVRERCCEEHARLCPSDLSHTVLPGVTQLLEWLAGSDHACLGLLSGNYEPVGRLKLARAGLGRFFPAGLGAFGSDSEDRTSLPAIARRRAGRRGLPHPRNQTVVIGDTPRDIACARADRVGCIALATGPFAADELGAADAVARDAFELRTELEATLRG